MELLLTIVLQDKDKDKPLDRSGIAPVATTKDPTIRTGVDQEIAHNLPDHVSLPKMTMPWIHLPSSAKRPMTRNARNTARQADASNVENKAILFMIVQTRSLAFIQLALFRFKMIMNLQPLKLPLQLCPSLSRLTTLW